ncbi:TIGR01459 family HAD-type hydrolase [Bosea sp. (in: a-proteobacteria)]|uniref:TIGR01459 family HAD-type hydrolase n=1 Tax=Bosea sp. (in: a-proteobacteria) TaxID=1871050 RepID=UPI002FC81561
MSVPASSERRGLTLFPSGIAALVARYDGFLLDQWGVLHDGSKPYPKALACLERMRQAGKAVIILSNSGRRGSENEVALARMGFPRELYDHLVSAGDDAREALASRDEPAYRELGKRCLLLARPGEEHLAAGLGLTPTEDPAEADFVFAMSMDAPSQSVAGWRALLEPAAARRLPMVCGNPDRYRVHADGTLYEAPGLVARAYEEIGGTVHYHGKPHARIYRTCLRLLGLPATRLLAIGDSLEHDVAGAAQAGIDSAFIAGGIHRSELLWSPAGEVESESCLRLFARERCAPQFALPWFRWE